MRILRFPRILPAAFVFGLGLLVLPAAPARAQVVIKVGTLAPEGSSWMKIFKRAGREIAKKTGGAVKIKLFGGGSQGDEKVMIEKMRTGQLQMAAITSVGLGDIASEVLVLQTPGLITDYATLDRVRNKLRGRFEDALRAKGFELLGWGDVGIVYFYSSVRVQQPADLKKGKVWVWNADPIAREMSRVARINPIPLGVPDVLPALNTGQINTFYSSPLATLSLQWFTRVKYRNTTPLAVSIGAIVISKAGIEAIPQEYRETFKSVMAKWSRALVRKVRADNDRSTNILRKQGIEDVATPPGAAKAAWESMARQVQEALVGKIYPRALLEEVRRMVGKK